VKRWPAIRSPGRFSRRPAEPHGRADTAPFAGTHVTWTTSSSECPMFSTAVPRSGAHDLPTAGSTAAAQSFPDQSRRESQHSFTHNRRPSPG